MFINTKVEAGIALEIAHRYGFTRLTVEDFHKRYTMNAFTPWSNEQSARDAQAEINEAIRADRESKRRPTKQELEKAAREEQELVAHNISARTGEPYNEVIKRIRHG